MSHTTLTLKRDIIYPIFLQCCKFSTESYWDNIFEDLAYGKTPFGTYISKDFLCCSYNNKSFTYKIDQKKDPEQIYQEIFLLFTDKVGLLSQKDKVKRRKDFKDLEDTMKDSRNKSWNDIKKKNIKELMIELYVISMKTKYALTIKQARHLLSILFVAMVFKVITSNDITYENGKINSIDGVDFVKKQFIIKRDLYKLDASFAANIVIDKKLMTDNWDKYLKDLRKISANNN